MRFPLAEARVESQSRVFSKSAKSCQVCVDSSGNHDGTEVSLEADAGAAWQWDQKPERQTLVG